MKIRGILPDQKHYQPISSKKEGCFFWCDKASPLVEVRSFEQDPWDKEFDIVFHVNKGKTRAGNRYGRSLMLACYSPDASTISGIIVRDRWKGRIFNSIEPCLAFYGIDCDEEVNQLLYTLVLTPEKPSLSAVAFEEKLIDLGLLE